MGNSRLGYGLDSGDSGRSVGVKLALAVGFLALAGGVVAAHRTPAIGYELSPYAATPPAFWTGIGAALAVSLSVAASRHRDACPLVASTLGGAAVVAVVAVPIFRGYFYYGREDALTHYGWARRILEGVMDPFGFLYPAGHLFGGAASLLLGIELRHALVLTVPLFVFLFLSFVTLTVRALVPTAGAVAAAGFVGFPLLPVFNVGASLMFVSFTLGMLFLPVVLFLLVLYVGRDSRRIFGPLPVSQLDLAVLVAAVALLLLHPQVFSDLLVVLGGVLAVQVVQRVRNPEGSIANQRTVFGQFAVLSALFVGWSANHSAASRTLRTVLSELTGSEEVGAIVQQRGSSLSEIGAGLPTMFVKLFLANFLVSLVAAWLVLRTLRGKTGRDLLDSWVRYLFLGGVLVGVYALLHFVGRTSSYFFRHLGVQMVLLTVLGGAALHRAGRSASGVLGPRVRRGATAAGVAVALVVLALSLAMVMPSPYVYSPSHHVPESSMNGYESLFDHRAEGVDFAGIRAGVDRYSDAVPGARGIAGDELFGDEIAVGLGATFDEDHYFVVTEVDRKRELRAYRELRVTREDLAGIGDSVGVSRVVVNGDFTAYYVRGGESESSDHRS